MHVVPEDLIITTRGSRLSARDRRTYVHIYSNVYVRAEALMPRADFWVAGQRVAEARLLALRAVVRDTTKTPITFVSQSALVAWGVKPTNHNPPVRWRGEVGSNKTIEFPVVKVGNVTIDKTVASRDRKNVGPRSPVEVVPGIFADPLSLVAVDLARCLPPTTAIAEVSAILRNEVEPSRVPTQFDRAREEELRQAALAANEEVPSRKGRYRASEVIRQAYAGAESPGEAALKWMLVESLRAGNLSHLKVVEQYRVLCGGIAYYLDLAIPEQMIAVEFDGMGKLETTRDGGRGKLYDEKAREDELRSLHWGFIRISSRELKNRHQAMGKLVEGLNRLGVPARFPQRW